MADPSVPPTQARRAEARLVRVDPFIGPQLVVAAAIVLDVFLPDRLTLGSSWLLPSVEGLLLLVLVAITPHPRLRRSPIRRRVAIALIAVVSTVNIYSLILLCHYLLHGKAHGRQLMFSGVALWVTNVLLFGLWYWELDRGGPMARTGGEDAPPDFYFTQMTDEGARLAPSDWTPGLIDYLYVSFTNATAFSPTDTMPLTQTAKLLMAAQAITSLLIVLLVISRAVGILS